MSSHSLKNISKQLDLGPVHTERSEKDQTTRERYYRKKFIRQRNVLLSLSLDVNEQLNRSKLKRPKKHLE